MRKSRAYGVPARPCTRVDEARDAARDRLARLLELAEIDARVVEREEHGRLVEQARRALVEQRRGLARELARLAPAAPQRRSASAQKPERDGDDVEHLRRAVTLRRGA